jgi:hypothetical protein
MIDSRYRVLAGYVLGILIIGLLPILACHARNSFKSLEQGDFSLVFSGKYKEATTLLRDGAEYKSVVDGLRTEIEKNLFYQDIQSPVTCWLSGSIGF